MTVSPPPPAPRKQPSPVALTDRDKRIFSTIEQFDGLLADYQIARLFFPNAGERTMRERLRLLVEHRYLARERYEVRPSDSTSSTIYWLDRQGAISLAAERGRTVKAVKPRRDRVPHALAINDFRIAIISACETGPHLSLEQWVTERMFAVEPDLVAYTDKTGRRTKAKIYPDGYFAVIQQREPNRLRARFLLEIDLGTESGQKFVSAKVLQGIAYLRSENYKKRFGDNSGRWLVVTTTERHLSYLKGQTEAVAGKYAKAFCFTTFDHVKRGHPLLDPLWWPGGSPAPLALFEHSS